MKKYILALILISSAIVLSCNNNSNQEPSLLTGNTETYTLYQASEYNVDGKVTFSEMKDGNSYITIEITPTEKGLQHPAHIHYLPIEESGDMAVVLNPVDGETGISSTELKELENGTSISYEELIGLNASVKVHLSATPPDYYTLLVGGNVGAAQSKENPFARFEITVCK